jgi:hypothetical protein
VSVAKKPDSLPQYSQKLGTNVDDKYEEVIVDLTLDNKEGHTSLEKERLNLNFTKRKRNTRRQQSTQPHGQSKNKTLQW